MNINVDHLHYFSFERFGEDRVLSARCNNPPVSPGLPRVIQHSKQTYDGKMLRASARTSERRCPRVTTATAL